MTTISLEFNLHQTRVQRLADHLRNKKGLASSGKQLPTNPAHFACALRAE